MEDKLKILEKIKSRTYRYNSYYKKGDYIFVTDGVFLVKLPESHFEHLCKDDIDTKFDNIDRAFKHPSYLDMKLTNDEFNHIYENIPVTYHHTICSACQGTGSVDFIFEYDRHDYINTDKCPVCGGSGVLEDDKEDIDPKYYIRMVLNSNKHNVDVIYFKYIKELIDAFDLKMTAYNMLSDDYLYFYFEDGTKIVILFNSYNQKNKKVLNFIELKDN